MLNYRSKLKPLSRLLRRNQTDAEALLWFRLRRKQFKNIQFYRQKPLGQYIVDFYAPAAKLVIEIDGSQHFNKSSIKKDLARDGFLLELGLKVLRFNNVQVLQSLEKVLEVIYHELPDF